MLKARIPSQSPFQYSDLIITFLWITVVLLLIEYGFIPLKILLPQTENISLVTLVLFLIQNLIFLLPVLILNWIRYRLPLKKIFSIERFPVVQGLLSVLKWYGLFLVFSIALAYLMTITGMQIPGYGEGENILPLFGNDPYSLPIMILVISFIAPLAEELFFRGFLLITLVKKAPYWAASLLTAIIFASIHFDFNAFFPRLLLGLILNQIVIENNKSIVPSLLFHILNNSIALALQLSLK